jgi:hypothetical protein
MKNPAPITGGGLTAAAPVYEQNCRKCHGVNGAANGSEAARLAAEPANFTDIKVLKAATDGELFWKITQAGMRCRRSRNCWKPSGGCSSITSTILPAVRNTGIWVSNDQGDSFHLIGSVT